MRTPQEEPHFVALSAEETSPLLLWCLTTTLEQIALREILLLEEIEARKIVPFSRQSEIISF
jgi:hypothetical protein